MSSNEKIIIERYSDTSKEDNRSFRSRAEYAEFHYTKKFISEYVTPETSVVEIGCATGYYGMFLADKCREYLGIDITPANVEFFNEKIKNNGLTNVKAMIGDATNLHKLSDNSFDVVLAFGPMYHLPPNEREKVFDECKRICKNNGIVIFAYINKAGAYISGCLREGWGDIYPNKNANEFVLKKATDDIRPDVFFFTMPEEVSAKAAEHGLRVIKNVGLDFLFNVTAINNMPDEQYEAWQELTDFMCESPSCVGLSGHALLICAKDD